jgi:hypothetical protein
MHRTPPGITLNDARLAIRIEKLFTDVYLADGRGRLTGDNSPAPTPGTPEELRQISPKPALAWKGKTKRLAEQNSEE